MIERICRQSSISTRLLAVVFSGLIIRQMETVRSNAEAMHGKKR